MTGFCKNKTCFETDTFLALMEEFKRFTFSETHCRTLNLKIGDSNGVGTVEGLAKLLSALITPDVSMFTRIWKNISAFTAFLYFCVCISLRCGRIYDL